MPLMDLTTHPMSGELVTVLTFGARGAANYLRDVQAACEGLPVGEHIIIRTKRAPRGGVQWVMGHATPTALAEAIASGTMEHLCPFPADECVPTASDVSEAP